MLHGEEIGASLDALTTQMNLLDHPFYREWTAGTLPLQRLRNYAQQYYRHVAAFPRYLSGIHARCEDLSTRQALLENLIDEERGGKIIRNCGCVLLSRSASHVGQYWLPNRCRRPVLWCTHSLILPVLNRLRLGWLLFTSTSRKRPRLRQRKSTAFVDSMALRVTMACGSSRSIGKLIRIMR